MRVSLNNPKTTFSSVPFSSWFIFLTEAFNAQRLNSKQGFFNLQSWLKKINPKFSLNKLLILIVLLVIIVSAIIIKSRNSNNNSGNVAVKGEKINSPSVKAKQILNKEFIFTIKDGSGKSNKIKYVIESAELQNEILLKGQRATSIAGRTFLILNIKVTNEQNYGIGINTKNFVRVKVNGKAELLAPDIHNDPVNIQAISTKYTRLGLPINDTDKDIVLQVGEIDGKKENIKLNLKYD